MLQTLPTKLRSFGIVLLTLFFSFQFFAKRKPSEGHRKKGCAQGEHGEAEFSFGIHLGQCWVWVVRGSNLARVPLDELKRLLDPSCYLARFLIVLRLRHV